MKTFGFLMLFSVFALFVEGCDYVLEDAQDDFEEDWNPYFGMDFSELHFDAADVTADEESGNRPIRYTHGTARVYDDLLLQFDQVEIKGTSGSNDVLKAWGCVEYLADGDPDGATRECVGGETVAAEEGDFIDLSRYWGIAFRVDRAKGACFAVKGALVHTRGDHENPIAESRYCWRGDLNEWVSTKDEKGGVGAYGEADAKDGAVFGAFTWRVDWEAISVQGALAAVDEEDDETGADFHQLVIPEGRLESEPLLGFELSALEGNPDLFFNTSTSDIPTEGEKCGPIVEKDEVISPDEACTRETEGDVYLSIVNADSTHDAVYELSVHPD